MLINVVISTFYTPLGGSKIIDSIKKKQKFLLLFLFIYYLLKASFFLKKRRVVAERISIIATITVFPTDVPVFGNSVSF